MAQRLEVGDKVRVAAPDEDNEPLKGKVGTITRKTSSGDEAWVNMDDELPENLQSFHDAKDPRHNHRRFNLDELAPAK